LYSHWSCSLLLRSCGSPSRHENCECSWIIRSYLKSAQYLPIKDIDLTSARGLKRKLDGTISSPQSESILSTVTETVASTFAVESTIVDLNLLFKDISLQGTSPAVLSLVPL